MGGGTADLHFACDALERLTNMIDAVGTTRPTPTMGGGQRITAEDGPRSGTSDTVTVTNRLGRSLGVRINRPVSSRQQAYTYSGGRLASDVGPADTFTYSYNQRSRRPGLETAFGSNRHWRI